MSRNHLYFFIATIFAFITDQISKIYVTKFTGLLEVGFIEVIPPIFNLQYSENRGINFGLLGGDGDLTRWLLIGVTSLVALLVYLWVRKKFNTTIALFAGLLIGGAIGNIWDRIYQGYVTDFINNSLPNWHNPFSYNLADIWIFIGIIGLIFWGPHEE